MKVSGKIAAAALAVTVFFSAAACAGNQKTAGGAAGAYTLWGVHSLVKVQSDLSAEQYAAERRNAALHYEMGKNEYENAQLIITAQGNISSFTASVSDLTGPDGAKIPKEDIAVYKQRYCYVKVNMTTARPFKPGWYPDALVPMDAAYEKGENSIDAGNNQGVWVTVKTAKNTPAGLYTGVLTLTIDGANESVPVTVEVWDITVPDEVHTQSCYHYFNKLTISGELSNSEEMWAAYVDTAMEYRISISDVPYRDFYDVEAWADVAAEYAAKARYSGFKLPYSPIVHTVTLEDPIDPANPVRMIPDVDYDLLEAQLRALAERSTPENPVLKKAFLYFSYSLDEAWMTGGQDTIRYINKKVHEKLIEVADAIEQEHGEGYWTDHGIERTDITRMQNLNTDPYNSEYAGYVPTYVPTVDNFQTAEQRALYEKEEKGWISSGTTWWYHCIDPYAPYPTYHIDDYLASARTISWMQYEYGIDGMLYWGTQAYPDAANTYGVPNDMWDDATKLPLRHAANGDGFLFYAGYEYGVYGPLPSVRLQAIRDGQEDYEYLWMFERELHEANEKYGTEYTVNQVLEKIFRSVYSGVITVTDADVIQNARRQIADLLMLISSDAQALVRIANVDADSETATVEVLYDGAYSLTADGKEQSGQPVGGGTGVKSVVKIPLTGKTNYFEGTLSNGTETIGLSTYVSSRVTSVARFEEDTDFDKLAVSKGNGREPFEHIAVEAAELDGRTAAKAVIGPSDMGIESQNVLYRPGVYFDKTAFFPAITMSDVDVVSVDLYNAGDKPVEVSVKVYAGAFSQTLVTATLAPKEWTTVKCDQVYNILWERMDSVTRLAIELPNELTVVRTLYIDSLYFSEKA